MGLNEFAGYVAVALSALATGMIASRYGLRPEPFYLGIAFASIGLALTTILLRDTSAHARLEGVENSRERQGPDLPRDARLSLRRLFATVTWRDPALSSASQAGLVNNLNDGLAWGLFPILFASAGLSMRSIAVLAFIYPATWGIVQLATGAASDRWGRKRLIVSGMLLQAAALWGMTIRAGFSAWAVSGIALGIGTAMVYPTLLASIGDVADPEWRGSVVGVYRFWRDLGYAFGALIGGLLADAFSAGLAILAVAALTAGSGLFVAVRMPETHHRIARFSAGRSSERGKDR
jgi:MFS family permease